MTAQEMVINRRNLKVIQKVKMHYKFLTSNKSSKYLTTLLPEDVYVMYKLHSISTFQSI